MQIASLLILALLMGCHPVPCGKVEVKPWESAGEVKEREPVRAISPISHIYEIGTLERVFTRRTQRGSVTEITTRIVEIRVLGAPALIPREEPLMIVKTLDGRRYLTWDRTDRYYPLDEDGN